MVGKGGRASVEKGNDKLSKGNSKWEKRKSIQKWRKGNLLSRGKRESTGLDKWDGNLSSWERGGKVSGGKGKCGERQWQVE